MIYDSMCPLYILYIYDLQVDDILIEPVLMRKNGVNVALFGLGAIRDERLNRMWRQNKVRGVGGCTHQRDMLSLPGQGRDMHFFISCECVLPCSEYTTY